MSKITIIEGNSSDKDNVRALMVKGERGYSAYEIAVQNGYTGTEEEWKDSFLNADNYYNKNEVNQKFSDVNDDLSNIDNQIIELTNTVNDKLNHFVVKTTDTYETITNYLQTAGAKIIEFEKGTYLFSDTLRITANTTLLLNNSTIGITDDPYAQTHHNRLFSNFLTTDEFLGYEGNGNITILNGNISNGSISFCHAKNINIKNINFIKTYADHYLEIAACNNYTVDNCNFGGVHITSSSRNYVECIQIDDMTRSNFPWFDNQNNPTYDNTTNNDIFIKNCKFYCDDTDDDFHIYTCIGGHTYVTDTHKNIHIYNCYFERYNYTAIRPFNWENLIIENCKFINSYLRYENNENNFIQKSILSPQRFINDLKFVNNYIYGSSKIYFNSDLTEAKNIYINNNTFIKQNLSYELENENYTFLSNGGNNEAVIILKNITKNINVCNNKMFDSQLKFLRADNLSKTEKPFFNICNNDFNCNLSLGFLHVYEDCYYVITNNNFYLDSVYADEYGTNTNALDIIRINPLGYYYIANNSYNNLIDIPLLDANDANNAVISFSQIYDLPVRLRTTTGASGSYNTIYSRKFTDFKKLILDIGINNEILANVIIDSKKINELITVGSYVVNKTIVNNNAVSNLIITINISDSTHFTFTITSDNETYNLYNIYGLNV